MKYLSLTLAFVATMAATLGSQACMIILVDEPTMPKSMIQ